MEKSGWGQSFCDFWNKGTHGLWYDIGKVGIEFKITKTYVTLHKIYFPILSTLLCSPPASEIKSHFRDRKIRVN